MKIKAGKYYKTRGGKKAFVLSVLEKSPFCETVNLKYPVIGLLGDRSDPNGSVAYEWALDGTCYNHSAYDLIEEWPEPKYRPFANADEFKPHRDRWIRRTDSGAFRTCSYTNREIILRDGDKRSYEDLCSMFVFDDTGEPVGVRE